MKILVIFLFILKISCRSYELSSSFSHSNSLFTQGLQYYNGYIYESAGMYGQSSVQIIHPDTGEILVQKKFDARYFAEGLTVVDDRVYVITWKEKTMFVLDSKTLEQLATYKYNTNTGEGWGLTYDGKYLVMSDGSDVISFFDLPTGPSGSTLRRVRDIRVAEYFGTIALYSPNQPKHKDKEYISRINELEMVNGFIYANVWYADLILKIYPSNGEIRSKYHLRDLFPPRTRPKTADCFNGIAFNSTDGLFTVTGKWWPKYYRVVLN